MAHLRQSLLLLALATTMLAQPPKTRPDNVTETLHGVKITDPYRWLEDQNAAETRAWIETQNQYTRRLLDPLPGRDSLKKRFSELLRIDATGKPIARGSRYFLWRRLAREEQGSLIMRQGLHGKDEVIVDAATLSKDGSDSVNFMSISDDGRLVAYGITKGGKDEKSIRILDVSTREHYKDAWPEGKYMAFDFSRDKKKVWYSTSGGKDPRVWEHAMGTPIAEDRQIFGQGYGESHILSCGVSDDGRWLQIVVYLGSSGDITEIYAKDLTKDGLVLPVVKGIEAAFDGDIAGDRFIARTNYKAPRWRVISIDLNHPEEKNWREIIPESKNTIEGTSLAGGQIFANFLEDVHAVVKSYTPEGKLIREVKLPAIGSVGAISGRWTSDEAFYSFASFHIPSRIIRLDTKTGNQEEFFRLNVPVDSDSLEVKQVWYPSKDGTKVPMFLLHKKGLKPNGASPVLLTGYGGFNVSNTPYFSSNGVLWAERGGIFALANLRGGGEFGEDWHRAGMLANKQNVFNDFIAAAEFLIRENYTNSKKLAISGGSNGGLLVGAALAQRPDLYQAVVCSYPLLDMIRYHKFLVAKFWVPEYGSSDDPKQFPYIRAYSPYHNLKPGTDYPATMFVTGDSDTRVAPLHARKMAALLQASTGGKRPVLLHYDTKAGHAGVTPAAKQIDDSTDVVSFLAWQLGVKLE